MKKISIVFALGMMLLGAGAALAQSDMNSQDGSEPFVRIDSKFTPRKLDVKGMPSASLDEALVRLFSKGGFDPDRYQRAEALIEQGAFVTEKAVYATAFTHPPDYRSLQTLYANGGFPHDLFSKQWLGGNNQCDFLLAALGLGGNSDRAPGVAREFKEATEQNAKFLREKFPLRRCADRLNGQASSFVTMQPSRPVIWKILLDAGAVDVQAEMKERLGGGMAFDPHGQWDLGFLVQAGARVPDHALAGLAYLASKPLYVAGGRVGETTSPAVLERALDALLPGVGKPYRDGQELLDRLRKYPDLQKAALSALDRAVGGSFTERQAQSAVLAELDAEMGKGRQADRRRVEFMLSRGVQPSAAQIYSLVRFGMADLAMPIVEKRPDLLDLKRFADAAAYGESAPALDWVLSQSAFNGAGLEAPFVHLIKKGRDSYAVQFVRRGTDAESAMKAAIAERLTPNELERAATACGETGRRLLVQHMNEQKIAAERAAKAAAEREKAQSQRSAEIRALHNRSKRVGDLVCQDGSFLGISHYTIKAYVEGVSGGRIQLRIASGMSVPGKQAGQIIWEPHTNWRACN